MSLARTGPALEQGGPHFGVCAWRPLGETRRRSEQPCGVGSAVVTGCVRSIGAQPCRPPSSLWWGGLCCPSAPAQGPW